MPDSRRSKEAADKVVVTVLLNIIDSLIEEVEWFIRDSDSPPSNWGGKLRAVRAAQKAARSHFTIRIKTR